VNRIFQIVLLLCLYGLVLGSANAQADIRDCDSVLELVGRENRFVMSSETMKKFEQRVSSRTGSFNATIPIKKLVVGIGGDSSKSSEDTAYQEWESEYISAADTVYGPAIDAWVQCKKIGVGITVVPEGKSHYKEMLFKAEIGVGYKGKIETIFAPENYVRCTPNKDIVLGESGVLTKTIKCRRNSGVSDYEEIPIVFSTAASGYSPTLYMPAKINPAPTNWDDAKAEEWDSSDTADIGAKWIRGDAQSDRLVQISYAPYVRGNCLDSIARLVVRVNGEDLGARQYPSGPNCRYTAGPYVVRPVIPAGAPTLITWRWESADNVIEAIRSTITFKKMPSPTAEQVYADTDTPLKSVPVPELAPE